MYVQFTFIQSSRPNKAEISTLPMITVDKKLKSSFEAPQPNSSSIQYYSGTILSQIMQKLMDYADYSITVIFNILRQVEDNLDQNATS